LPELCRPAYSPNVVLDTFALQMYDSPYSTTADSYFGSLDWLAAHPSIPSWHALSKERYPLLLLFAYELPAGCYRIFRRGAMYVSVWCDDDVVRCCATNAYTFSTTALPRPLLLFSAPIWARANVTLPLLFQFWSMLRVPICSSSPTVLLCLSVEPSRS